MLAYSSPITKFHSRSIVDVQDSQPIRRPQSLPIPKQCSYCCEKKIKYYSRSVFTCGHNEICFDCLLRYADHCLQQNNILRCDAFKCSGTLKHEDEAVMHIFPFQLKDRLLRKIRDRQIKYNKQCTQPDCFGFINHGSCDLCLTIFCESCYGPEHLGSCMAQVQLPEGTKQCPNCNEGIEKDGGCLKMECQRCKHRFCFKCLGPWSRAHHNSCGLGDLGIMSWMWAGLFGD